MLCSSPCGRGLHDGASFGARRGGTTSFPGRDELAFLTLALIGHVVHPYVRLSMINASAGEM
jgi:hypothetical protein